MAKVTITSSFHRFVPNPASTAEKPLKELREDFPAGKTVDATEDDAEAWKAAGLAAEPNRIEESAAE